MTDKEALQDDLIAAARANDLDAANALLEQGADPLLGLSYATGVEVYERLAPTPRTGFHAQEVLETFVHRLRSLRHDPAPLTAALLRDGAVLGHNVIGIAINPPVRTRFFEGAQEAGADLNLLWEETKNGKGPRLRKTLRDKRVKPLAELSKSLLTSKNAVKEHTDTLGDAPSEPIPVGDPRWQAAQKLAHNTRTGVPSRREFEAENLPDWIGAAVEQSLPLLPESLAAVLEAFAPTQAIVLAALAGGSQGTSPLGAGLLTLACTDPVSPIEPVEPVLEALLDAGVSPQQGCLSPVLAYGGTAVPSPELLNRLVGDRPLTAREAGMFVDLEIER